LFWWIIALFIIVFISDKAVSLIFHCVHFFLGGGNWTQALTHTKYVLYYCTPSPPFFIFSVILSLELKASHLWGRSSTTWTMPPAYSTLVILERGSCFLPSIAWTRILLFSAFCYSCEDRQAPPLPSFFLLRWDLMIILVPGWQCSWFQPPK
jgi:hypothetical protein